MYIRYLYHRAQPFQLSYMTCVCGASALGNLGWGCEPVRKLGDGVGKVLERTLRHCGLEFVGMLLSPEMEFWELLVEGWSRGLVYDGLRNC